MFREFDINESNLEEQKERVLQTIRDNEKKIEELLGIEEKTYNNFITPYQLMHEKLGFYFSPVSHLNSVKNSKKTQDIYSSLLPVLTEYYAKLGQNEELYKAVKEIYQEEKSSLNKERKKVLTDLILEFELSGVGLEEKKQKEIKEIMISLSDLQNRFAQNLLDATNAYEMFIEDEEELRDFPKSDLESAKVKKEGKNLYRFTLQQPSYIAYMTYGKNRENREKLYKAYVTRAPENEKILEEILDLRYKKASLLGFSNYAQLSLAKKMAKDPKTIINFLKELAKKSRKQALREFEELKDFAKEKGFDGELKPFDLSYYSEKLKKEKYSVNDEDYMPYFEKNRVVNGLFEFVKKLFKIEFKKITALVWDEKVLTYELYKDGDLIGRLYLDLEAREDKRGGAWMDEWVTHHINERREKIFPIAYIVANFAPSSEDSPSLLRPNDVETLFHEAGHALHHLLSKVEESFVSGINGVEWDAVEFPSQFLENFAYEESVLQMFAHHHKTGELLPKEMIKKLKISKNFQSALAMLRQIEFALFDMLIHLKRYNAKEVQNILNETREEIAVIKPPKYNKFQWGFAHIFAGGYAAGYYSYKWAEVLSADAFYMFVENGIFNDEIAESFYSEILTKGGSRKAMESFVSFKGEEPDIEALLKVSGIE